MIDAIVTALCCVILASTAALIIAIPFYYWLRNGTLFTATDGYNVFQMIAGYALIIGVAHVVGIIATIVLSRLLFFILRASPKSRSDVERIGESLSNALMLLYGVPGLICGWIAISWWLMTGKYLTEDLHHPGILERLIALILLLGGRILGFIGLLLFGKMCLVLIKHLNSWLRGLGDRTRQHGKDT